MSSQTGEGKDTGGYAYVDPRVSTSTFLQDNARDDPPVRIDMAALRREIRTHPQLYHNDALPPDWAQHYHFIGSPEATLQYIFVLDSLNFCFWPLPGYEYEHLAGSLKIALEQDPKAFDARTLANATPSQVAEWLSHLPIPQTADNEGEQGSDGGDGTEGGAPRKKRLVSDYTIPLLEERVRHIQQLGTALLEHYDGQAAGMVRAAGHSAQRLVRLITAHMPNFRDHMSYTKQGSSCGGEKGDGEGKTLKDEGEKGDGEGKTSKDEGEKGDGEGKTSKDEGENAQPVVFGLYKRAQILVGDIWGAFRCKALQPSSSDKTPYSYGLFTDMDTLTCFADYRIPQLLNHLGILVYSPALQRTVDKRITITRDSVEEMWIRVCTVQAVELMVQEANDTNAKLEKKKMESSSGDGDNGSGELDSKPLRCFQMDWLLWERGEAMLGQLPPHHRVLTTCY